jgi:hypothetical protein
MDSIDHNDAGQAFKVNRLAAIGMAVAAAASLLLLHPELSLIYIAQTGAAVYLLSWARTKGVFGKPRPVTEQNFAAYVAVSTLSFVATLAAAPQMIEIAGSTIYFAFAAVIAVLVLRAIWKGV